MATHKEKLHEDITQLQLETKRGNLPREHRLMEINTLTESYYAKTGERPDSIALERMADLCLYEELTDNDRMKVRNNEYPFFSEHQFEERYKAEVSLKVAEEQGVDGRNYKPPGRRDRTNREIKFLDKHARIRNKERQRVYHEFTKVQPVYIQKMSN